MEIVSHHHKSANGTSINCLKQSREVPLRFRFRSSEKRSTYVFDSTRLNWWAVIACSLFAIEMCEVTCFAVVKRPCSRMYSWALRGVFSLHHDLHRLHFQERNQMPCSGSKQPEALLCKLPSWLLSSLVPRWCFSWHVWCSSRFS